MAKKKIRLDQLLVNMEYFDDVEQAKRAVMAREVRVDTTYVSSAAIQIELDDNDLPKSEIFVKGQKKFVSRGGLKLQGAIEEFNLNVKEKKCLDIGSSTGGFTDCLLQSGAKSVTCVDVGYGILAWRISQHPSVNVFERLNIKDADNELLNGPFDVIVTDVSFISLASLSDKIADLCADNGIFVGLIKPQFESDHSETVNGIVVDENVRQRTIEEVSEAFKRSGFEISGIKTSPIKGTKGNIEYLLYCQKK